MAINVTLSCKLGELRWTQADLARKTGIRAARINEIYWDIDVGRVTLDQIDLICDALHCSLYDIVEWEPNTEAEQNIPHVDHKGKSGRDMGTVIVYQGPVVDARKYIPR